MTVEPVFYKFPLALQLILLNTDHARDGSMPNHDIIRKQVQYDIILVNLAWTNCLI